MNAVNTRVNAKNDHILMRSAMAPDTMEAAVATNTIWKNQSDITAYPLSTTLPTALRSPSSRAFSALDGP